ncbi:endonuclease/exonuclease/phosphatase family protein [Fodinibius saliphilus]|uniref:endonuclease/exonuclease/phosphatase family protein n=1 Tax=Fodinibius saliphilus TaxID=1920650 RepID=UPI0014862F54|nr:endonuclease/exonuclease/phosphatase family protein [Fodinibius saliphilus]
MKQLKLTLIPVSLLLIFFNACGTEYEPPPEDKEDPKAQITPNDPVAADDTLETVTWNIEWYGDGDEGNGPSDELQQTKNILSVTDSLKADLYAFQEVYSQKAIEDIASNMKGYQGFVANHIDWIQKTGFVYNTNTIDSISTGPITQGQSEYAWAGRLPLYFQFSYKNSGKEFYAIVIHAKANTGDNAEEYEEAYNRRKQAAQDLYDYLQNEKPDANIILLGDYNDDVDESIFYYSEGDYAETPYEPFVANTTFQVITNTLTQAGKSSTVRYDDMIDHISMSDELYSFYIDKSTNVFQFDDSFITNYGTATSDHYPVWAKFNVGTSKTLTRN